MSKDKKKNYDYTQKERVKRFRESMKERGFTLFSTMVPIEKKEEIQAYIVKIREKYKKEKGFDDTSK